MLLALLLFAPSTTEAQGRWQRIYRDKNVTIEVDTTSIRERNANIEAWMQWTYTELRPRAEARPAFKSARSKIEFACFARQSRLISAVYYDVNGTVVHNWEPDNSLLRNEGWADLVPDTVGESELLGVCNLAGRNAG